MDSNQEFSLYKDMKARTNGEIYIGVVGPVRTGKSTFIKRFMDLCVLPQMENEHVRARAKDELPQSAAGTTIMTTEPKFIPSEAALIYPMEDVGVKVRPYQRSYYLGNDCCNGNIFAGTCNNSYSDSKKRVFFVCRKYYRCKYDRFRFYFTNLYIT